MSRDENIMELREKVEKSQWAIDSLERIEETLENVLEVEYDLLLDRRTDLISMYIDDDELEGRILKTDPEKPIDLLTSVREILNRDPPSFIIRELLPEHGFDRDDIDRLRRRSDVSLVGKPLENDPTVKIYHMVEE